MDSSTSVLEAWLREHTRFQRLLHVVTCPSTQQLAQDDVGSGDCAVFWADHQTAGRGRGERSWEDAAGLDLSVTFKVRGTVLKNPAQLAAAVPVVIVQALGDRLGDPLQIKWPNDVLLHGRKLGGILVDSAGSDPVNHLVGIGINVNGSTFPAELADQATSLALATGREFDRAELLQDIAGHLEAALTHLEAGNLAPLEEIFRQCLGLLDRRVVVQAADQVSQGRLRQLDFDSLQLEGQPPIPLAHVQRLEPFRSSA
ncbi:MAG: biotin--[acetyl-CoA-carboxylase] ligase [Planctomycetota bacterium]|jgi:BirA family biotin operon repressor/biotin-[acetyl-CoA-carboxylase] ligase